MAFKCFALCQILLRGAILFFGVHSGIWSVLSLRRCVGIAVRFCVHRRGVMLYTRSAPWRFNEAIMLSTLTACGSECRRSKSAPFALTR